MKIRSLCMENFLSHKDTCLHFPSDGMLLIHGENGSGKTSVLDAITFALTGFAPPRATSVGALSDLLHYGEHMLRVTLVLESSNDTFYRIERVYNSAAASNKTAVTLSTGDREVFETGEGWKVVTNLPREAGRRWREISDVLLGMPSDALLLGPIILQGQASALVEEPPSSLRQKLLDLLLGKDYKRLVDELGKMRKAHAKKLQQLTAEEAGVRLETLSDDDRDARNEELRSVRQRLTEVAAALDAAQSASQKWMLDFKARFDDGSGETGCAPHEVTAAIKRGKTAREEARRMRVSRQATERERRALLRRMREEYLVKKRRLDNLPADIDDNIAHVQSQIAKLETQAGELPTILAELKNIEQALGMARSGGDGVCPVCGSQVSARDLKQHITQNLLPKQALLQKQKVQIEQAQRAMRERRERLVELQRQATVRQQLMQEVAALKERGVAEREQLDAFLKEKHEAYRRLVRSARKDIVLFWEAVRVAREHGLHLSAMLSTLQNLDDWGDVREDGMEEEKIAALREEKRNLEERLAVITHELKVDEAAREKLGVLEREKANLEAQVNAMDWLAAALDKNNGVPREIMSEMLDEIATKATEYARPMFPGLSRIYFRDDKGKLSVRSVVRSNDQAVTMLSTGERAKVGLAVRMALMDIITRQRGVQFVLSDETLANMDMPSRRQFMRLLQSNQGGRQIILVSHAPVPVSQGQAFTAWSVSIKDNTSVVNTSPDEGVLADMITQD